MLLGQTRILAICLQQDAVPNTEHSEASLGSVDWKGFKERDLVIVEIRKNSNPRLVEIAQCKNKLEYVLIGKDQTQKKRWNVFPSNESLYSLIDAMPMRRYEMKQRAGYN